MKKSLITSALIVFVFLFLAPAAVAQWQEDSYYKFKIKIPTDWSKNNHMDGTDKIFEFYTPDENAGIMIRTFDAGEGVTTDLLAQVYEEQYLPEGTKKVGLNDHTSKNGIPGKQGSYILSVEGIDVLLANFYTVQNSKGYVLSALVVNSMTTEYESVIKEATQSFIIEGFSASSGEVGGLGGLVGKTAGASKSIGGRYKFVGRSDGASRVNYHYIDVNSNGTYVEKYQPKNSGDYVGGTEGTWETQGNQLILVHGGLTDIYVMNGNEITRTSDDGVIFTFRK